MFRNVEANAYQRQRWMRPDAFRWLRPDAARWRRPVHPIDAKYNPDQPRVPAGHSDGGQWTSRDGSGSSRSIDDERVLSDADPEQLIPGAQYAGVRRERSGHHIVPQSVYRDWSGEAHEVLKNQTIGPIDNRLILRMEPDGKTLRHVYDHEHRQYNRAADELSKRIIREEGIDTSRMTGRQALDIRAKIDASDDPRLRDYNATMRWLARTTIILRRNRGE